MASFSFVTTASPSLFSAQILKPEAHTRTAMVCKQLASGCGCVPGWLEVLGRVASGVLE